MRREVTFKLIKLLSIEIYVITGTTISIIAIVVVALVLILLVVVIVYLPTFRKKEIEHGKKRLQSTYIKDKKRDTSSEGVEIPDE